MLKKDDKKHVAIFSLKCISSSGMHAAAVIARGIEKGHNDFSSFELDVSQRYAQYQDMRTHFYHMEKRWPEARFWRKYQGLPQAVA